MRPTFTLLLLAACHGAPVPSSALPSPTGTSHDTDDTGDTGDAPWDVPWDTACNPLATADDCLLPFPSLYYTTGDSSSPTGLRLDISLDDFSSPDGPLPIDPALFSFADGVSPVSAALVNFGVDIDPGLLSGWGDQEETVQPGAPIALLNAQTGEAVPILTEMDQANRDLDGYDDRHALIVRPLAPMQMGARYAVVLTRDLVDVDGNALDSPPVFEALRDDIATSDEVVEGMRDRYEDLFAVVEDAGWTRSDLLLMWDFQVASQTQVLGPIRSARQQTMDYTADHGIAFEIASIEVDPNENVALLVKGTFHPPSFLTDDNALDRDDEGGLVLQEGDWPGYDFTMVVPPAAHDGGGLPLVLIGHGLFMTGEQMLDGGIGESITQPLAAEHGAVLVATDWIGLSGGDLNLIIEEVISDMSRVTVITERLVQSHVNNLALVELVLSDDLSEGLGLDLDEPLVDPDRVYYYGVSLGGIQGSAQVSISPRISRAVAAVPGAGWSHMIQRSTQFWPLEDLVDALYPDPLAQLVFVTGVQTFFDFSDPANLGTLLNDDPDYPDLEHKVLILQEAIGDCQVPNLATDLLSRTVGASHLDVATDPVYGLGTVKGPTTAVSLTQIRVPEDLDAYFPPDQNTLPEVDNGVHSDAVLQDVTLEQVGTLFLAGQAVHPCDGVCDPD